ncbi:MAG TPA: FG-GAP-like repeat-containing protein, partial [Chitinophagales bacterium]|nr:FG-GAP-like repeat-containing protein [Chitinophagales bacterium]
MSGYESGVASPLNSTIFKYGSTATANSTQNFTASVVAGKKAETLTGDFNGDGLDDLFVAYYTITGQYPRKYTDYKVYLRNSAGTDFLTTPSATGTFPATAYWDGGNSGTVCSLYVELFVTDIDGNGKADITITKRGRMFYNGYARLLGAYTLSGNNSATSFTLQDYSSQMSVFGDINSGNYFITGDFDGDQRTDWMTMSGADNNLYVHFPAKNSFNNLISNYSTNSIFENCLGANVYFSDKLKVDDFDADGKDDILTVSGANGYTTCQSYANKDAVYTIYYDETNSYYDVKKIAGNKLVNNQVVYEFNILNDYTGDFNGDGKVDVFTPNYNGTFKIKYSSGRRQSTDYNFPFNESVSLQDVNGHREFFSIGDFNGDGKSDIAHQYLSGTNTHNVSVYYSNGSGFQQVLSTFNYDTLCRPYKVADFNGDGIDDLVDTLTGNTGQLYITYLKPKNQDYLLTKIKDGYERVTEFQYKLFTESSGIYTYTAPTGNIYPLQINVPRTNGVYKMIMPDGSGNVTNTTYTQYAYANAVSHKAGKGFLGFKTHKSTDNLTTLTTEITNDVINNNTNFYLFSGINAKTYYLATPANLLTQSIPTYEITDLGNKRFVINTTQHKNTNYITDIENTEGLTQDGDGNITQSVNTIKTASSQLVNQTTTTIITGFSISPPSVIPSLPQVVNTTNSYGGSSYSVETKNEYTNGLLTKVTLFNNLLSVNPSPSVISLIEYDVAGNVLKTTITPSNTSGSVASRYTRYEYQPNFKTIYKTYSSGVSGEILTSEVLAYDPRFGVPSTIKNGIYTNYITTNVFDAFGRLKSGTLAPNNITTNTQWQWDNSVSNGIVKTVSTTTGAPLSIVYADRLGRTIKTSTENFSGALISSSTTYDNMGRVLTTIAPDGSNAGTNMTTNYSYLPITGHYRLNTVSSSLGTVSYTYTTAAGLNSVKTTYPGSRISEVFTDASGKTVKTTDNAGTVYTTYNAQGMPLQINAADATTTMEYDAATGRQTKLIEPNSGTTEYKYNGYGELIYTKDNKGFEWEMQYDALGRTTQKNRKAYSNKPNTYPATDADQLTQYFYETATNGKEQLKLKKINGTTVEEYIYDAWHRNTAITQTIDASTILTTAFEYNTDNSIKSITYPENVKFNYNYTALGYLQSVKNGDNTITLYQTNTTNAYNTPLQYTLGNGKTTNITLLANGQMSNTQTLLSGTTYIQKLNYTIPDITTGNITQRKDETKAVNMATDVFAYETQYDRLSSITTNGNAARTWTYDNDKNGNVKSSTDLGNFSYHAVKKHALTKTELNCTQTGTQVPIQTLDYTPANQPARIIKPGTPNSYEMLFSYGADDTRVKSELKLNGAVQSTRYYSGNYEKWISAGNTKHIYYIYGSTGLCAIATKDNGSSSLNYYYAYTDHLGSLLKLTDNTGNTLVEQSFDAWGRYRDPNNWASYTASAPSGSFAWLRKGFTAHEHLPEFGLILMAQNNNGGRLYDPLTGRMLSPDPFVQNPTNTQAYNRYSYALNNPL